MVAPQELVDLCIRPMHRDDIHAVMQIEEQAYDFPWTEGIMRDCLRVGYSAWVMEWRSGIHAYGFLSVVADECHVLNISVEPALQRRGIGRQLMEFLLETARGHQAQRCFLEVRTSNRAARRMYRSMGFEEIGRRKEYYRSAGKREDAIVLTLDLV